MRVERPTFLCISGSWRLLHEVEVPARIADHEALLEEDCDAKHILCPRFDEHHGQESVSWKVQRGNTHPCKLPWPKLYYYL